MAEEPGKCRYIMGILEKNKKSKGTAFVYDENNDYYKMEINGIEFVCDSIHSDYEKHAVELAQAYEKRLPDIVDYLTICSLKCLPCCNDVTDRLLRRRQ